MHIKKIVNSMCGLILLGGCITYFAFNIQLRSTNAQSAVPQKKSEGDVQDPMPIANYNDVADTKKNTGSQGEKRASKNKKHNSGRTVQISELPSDVETLPLINHSLIRLPALPVDKSDLILIAEIIDSKAFLSDDKTEVYSEYTVSATGVFKNISSLFVASGTSIVAERNGGAIRFPSGRIQNYRISKQGVPQIGQTCLLFLKRNLQDDDFSILTGYELRNGKVYSLDKEEQFLAYTNTDKDTFLSEITKAIQKGGAK